MSDGLIESLQSYASALELADRMCGENETVFGKLTISQILELLELFERTNPSLAKRFNRYKESDNPLERMQHMQQMIGLFSKLYAAGRPGALGFLRNHGGVLHTGVYGCFNCLPRSENNYALRICVENLAVDEERIYTIPPMLIKYMSSVNYLGEKCMTIEVNNQSPLMNALMDKGFEPILTKFFWNPADHPEKVAKAEEQYDAQILREKDLEDDALQRFIKSFANDKTMQYTVTQAFRDLAQRGRTYIVMDKMTRQLAGVHPLSVSTMPFLGIPVPDDGVFLERTMTHLINPPEAVQKLVETRAFVALFNDCKNNQPGLVGCEPVCGAVQRDLPALLPPKRIRTKILLKV